MMVQHINVWKHAYLILSLMLFILRIYFEDVQPCLTIQRAVQIVIVTPERDKHISREHHEQEEEVYKLVAKPQEPCLVSQM